MLATCLSKCVLLFAGTLITLNAQDSKAIVWGLPLIFQQAFAEGFVYIWAVYSRLITSSP
jgi:hypothetical protein